MRRKAKAYTCLDGQQRKMPDRCLEPQRQLAMNGADGAPRLASSGRASAGEAASAQPILYYSRAKEEALRVIAVLAGAADWIPESIRPDSEADRHSPERAERCPF